MNAAHWHLAINHLPIIASIIAFLVLLFGLLFKQKVVQNVGLALFIFAAFAAIPSLFTGEAAHEYLEGSLPLEESYVERHEDRAKIFSFALGGLALLASVGLILYRRWEHRTTFWNILVLLASLIVLWFAKETGTTGGEIRHTEIRTEWPIQNPTHVPNVEHEDD